MKNFRYLLILPVTAIVLVGCTTTNTNDKPSVRGEETNVGSVTWCVVSQTEEKTCFDPISFEEGDNAYTTFESLDEREEALSFESTDYGPELGQFVTSINGIEGSAEAFWKLYYNDTGAEVGISQLEVEDKDQLSFVYEAVQN